MQIRETTGVESLNRAGMEPPALDLEAIRRLMEQGNTGQANAVLQYLESVLGKRFTSESTGTAYPEPFSAPQASPFGLTPLNLPSPSRVEGKAENLATALQPGSPEWNTVQLALQQHENLHFDADNQRFFTTLSDGSKVDLCSVYDVEDIIQQNGGFTDNASAAVGPVSDFFKQKIDEASQRPFAATNTLAILAGHPPISDPSRITLETYNTQVEELKRRLTDFDTAWQTMALGFQVRPQWN